MLVLVTVIVWFIALNVHYYTYIYISPQIQLKKAHHQAAYLLCSVFLPCHSVLPVQRYWFLTWRSRVFTLLSTWIASIVICHCNCPGCLKGMTRIMWLAETIWFIPPPPPIHIPLHQTLLCIMQLPILNKNNKCALIRPHCPCVNDLALCTGCCDCTIKMKPLRCCDTVHSARKGAGTAWRWC